MNHISQLTIRVLISCAIGLVVAGYDYRPSKGADIRSFPSEPVNFYKANKHIKTLSPKDIIEALKNTNSYTGVGYWADLLPVEAPLVFKIIFLIEGNTYKLYHDKLYVQNKDAKTGKVVTDYSCDICVDEPFAP